MKKNNSEPQFGLNIKALQQHFQGSNKYQRKLEGCDIKTTGKAFAAKVDQLKNRPVKQTLQDQYITGLQDQIQYLQLQLKLLKDKQASKLGQFDQLQKFFGDGIPINQNILAIKNGFNNYKKSLQQKISDVQRQKIEREGLIEGLRNTTDDLHKDVSFAEKQLRQMDRQQSNKYHQLLGKQAGLKKQIEIEDEILKNLKAQNRKMAERMSALHRNKEIQMVINLKNENHKLTKLTKYKQQLLQKEQQFEKLIQEYQMLRQQEEQKTYVVNIEEDNIALKKKIISMEKDVNSMHTKVDQMKMELQAKLKERQKEITAKMEMKNRVDQQKFVLSRENSLSVEQIEAYVKQRQLSMLKKAVQKNKKLSKYTSYYSQLLSKVEDSVQQLVEKKPQLKSQITAYANQITKLIKAISEQQARESKLLSEIITSDAKGKHLNDVIPYLQDKLKKNNDQSNVLSNECNCLTQELKVKEKQLQLITILKSLSIEEVEISKSTSGSIQQRLINFMRNWQSLQRTN